MQRVGWGPLQHPSIYYIAVYSYWYYIYQTKYQAANTAPSKRRMNNTWEERSLEIAKKGKKAKKKPSCPLGIMVRQRVGQTQVSLYLRTQSLQKCQRGLGENLKGKRVWANLP